MAETPDVTRSTEHEITIDAPPEAVFAYFTDPMKIVRWMGSEATLDPRPGGVCRVNMRREIGEVAVIGKFVEVIPYSRIVFTWGWEQGPPVRPGSTTVVVELLPEAEGTLIRLTHKDLPPDQVDIHRHGWEHYASRLAAVADGRDPGPNAPGG